MLQKRSNPFEDYIQQGFAAIRAKTGAWLHWVNPAVRPIGLRGNMPVFAMVGSALYDIGGWTNENNAVHRAVGIELKASTKFKQNIPIIKPESKGSGVQYHQLEALAALHRDGGIAGLVWNNGGVIGYASGEVLAAAFYDYETSRVCEEMKRPITKGVRSLSWQKFATVEGTNHESWWLEGFHKPRGD